MLTLDKQIIERNGLSLGKVLLLIAIQSGEANFREYETELKEKGFISTRYDPETFQPNGYFVTNKGAVLLQNIVLDSDRVVGNNDFTARIEALVPLLQDIYPKGKNFNNQYWRGNKTDIKRKLQTFFKKYGTDYTDQQILDATKAYVSGFNSEYRFMRLLQYFIWKEEVKDGTKVSISELANYIENEGQTTNLTDEWTYALT